MPLRIFQAVEDAPLSERSVVAEQNKIEIVSANEATPLSLDEQAMEQILEEEQRQDFLEGETVTPQEDAVPTSGAATTPVALPDDVLQEVRKILEDGLGDFVAQMPEVSRQRFIHKGGEVSTLLARMVRRAKISARDILRLIYHWLLTIPGVNKFFLEQEAKIKTDRVMTFGRSWRAEQGNNVNT